MTTWKQCLELSTSNSFFAYKMEKGSEGPNQDTVSWVWSGSLIGGICKITSGQTEGWGGALHVKAMVSLRDNWAHSTMTVTHRLQWLRYRQTLKTRRWPMLCLSWDNPTTPDNHEHTGAGETSPAGQRVPGHTQTSQTPYPNFTDAKKKTMLTQRTGATWVKNQAGWTRRRPNPSQSGIIHHLQDPAQVGLNLCAKYWPPQPQHKEATLQGGSQPALGLNPNSAPTTCVNLSKLLNISKLQFPFL